MAKRDLMLLTAESVMNEANRVLRRRIRIALHIECGEFVFINTKRMSLAEALA